MAPRFGGSWVSPSATGGDRQAPLWNSSCTMVVYPQRHRTVHLKTFDSNIFARDELIGCADVQLIEHCRRTAFEEWKAVWDPSSGGGYGTLHIKSTFAPHLVVGAPMRSSRFRDGSLRVWDDSSWRLDADALLALDLSCAAYYRSQPRQNTEQFLMAGIYDHHYISFIYTAKN